MPLNLLPPILWQSVPFGDPDAFADWAGHHWLWHQALAGATQTRLLLLDDLRTELLPHSRMHQDLARALDQPPAYDLVSYDLRDRGSYYGFMQTHALEHDRLHAAAGL